LERAGDADLLIDLEEDSGQTDVGVTPDGGMIDTGDVNPEITDDAGSTALLAAFQAASSYDLRSA
jgi:hypothetical protein